MRTLSPRVLKRVLDILKATPARIPTSDLVAVIERALGPKRGVANRKAIKAAKRATKYADTALIREAVFKRARGLCEICLCHQATELHHAFGRIRVPQSTKNTLALCSGCHGEVTENRPNAASCWRWVSEAFDRLGHRTEAERAHARMKFVETRGALAVAR